MGNNFKNTYAQSNSDSYTYLRDVEDKYLLDSVGDYLMTFYKKENPSMAQKKYVSIEKLGLYDEKIKKVISDGDQATLNSAKGYADSLASNYDAAGTAATAANAVQENLTKEVNRAKGEEKRIEGLVTTAQNDVNALELVVAEKADASALGALSNKVGLVPEGSTVMGIIQNIQESAYDDTEIRGLIAGLDNTKANKTQVATDIAAAVKAEENARKEAVSGVNAAVNGLAQTHATDKKALEDAIALKADQTSLKATNETLAAVKKDVDDFFKDALGDTEAQAVKDTLRELQDYIASDESGAVTMAGNIQSNASAIQALAGRMKTAESDIDAVEERAGALEGRMTTAEANIAKKVDNDVYTSKVEALEQADQGQVARIAALEGKFTGEGSVESQIQSAVATVKSEAAEDATNKANQALKDAKAYTDTEVAEAEKLVSDLETVVNGKAAQSDLNALAGRVTTAEGKITTLEGKMTTAEGKIAANEGAIKSLQDASATHATTEALNAVSGKVQTLEAWHNNFIEASEEDINALFPSEKA